MNAYIDEPGDFEHYMNLPGYAGYKAYKQTGVDEPNIEIGPELQCSMKVSNKVTTVALLIAVNSYHCMVCISAEYMINSIEEAKRLAPHENTHTIYCTPTMPKGANLFWP